LKTPQKQKRTFEKIQGLLRIFKDFWGFSGTFGGFSANSANSAIFLA
jgi:hypothetical protein